MKHINVLALLLSLFSSSALAWSSMGEAEVQIRDGNICFTITDKEFKQVDGLISFWKYTVYKKRENGRGFADLWGFTMDKSIPFKKGDCIQYGELPKEARLGSRFGVAFPEKAPVLQTNVVYGLDFSATGSHTPTHGYGTDFCLKQVESGALVVKKVNNNMNPCDEKP